MTTDSEMTPEMTMSDAPPGAVVLHARAPGGASAIVTSGAGTDQELDEDGTSAQFADPADEVLRRMGRRWRTPVAECDDAPEAGTPLGPMVSFRAVVEDTKRAADDYGEVIPVMKWVTLVPAFLPWTLNALFRAGEHMTQRNGRFYGTAFAGGLTVLVAYLVLHFTHR